MTSRSRRAVSLSPCLFAASGRLVISTINSGTFTVNMFYCSSGNSCVPLQMGGVNASYFGVRLINRRPATLMPSILGNSLNGPGGRFTIEVNRIVPVPGSFTCVRFNFSSCNLKLSFAFSL